MFSSTRKYAVIGASANPSKFGYKVLKWYTDRKLPVYAVNPKKQEILGVETTTSLNELLANNKISELSLSFITPPEVTFSTINSIDSNNLNKVKMIWFQPGSFDSKVLKIVEKLGLKCIYDDCILVSGDSKL